MNIIQILGSTFAVLGVSTFFTLLFIASSSLWEDIRQHEAKIVSLIWFCIITTIVCLIIKR